MSLEFAQESYSEALISEMLPIFEQHYQEVAHFKDIKLKPDLMLYENAYRNGTLRIFTARYLGQLCGYMVFFVRSNPHYQDSIQAVQDILYLCPPMRQGLSGYKFLSWCESELKADGVQAVYHHVKTAHDFGNVLIRMGYEPVDMIYAKRLDKDGA